MTMINTAHPYTQNFGKKLLVNKAIQAFRPLVQLPSIKKRTTLSTGLMNARAFTEVLKFETNQLLTGIFDKIPRSPLLTKLSTPITKLTGKMLRFFN